MDSDRTVSNSSIKGRILGSESPRLSQFEVFYSHLSLDWVKKLKLNLNMDMRVICSDSLMEFDWFLTIHWIFIDYFMKLDRFLSRATMYLSIFWTWIESWPSQRNIYPSSWRSLDSWLFIWAKLTEFVHRLSPCFFFFSSCL